jgi:hypothetical protein
MKSPQSRKDVQKLTSRIEALNRFTAKLAEWSLPFFTVLRGSTNFEWGLEQQQALEDLKAYLQQLPTLSSLEQGQLLILYVSASHTVVSGTLVQEKEATKNGAKRNEKSNNKEGALCMFSFPLCSGAL